MSALRRFVAELPSLPRAVRLAVTASPGWFAAWALLLVLGGAVPAVIVVLSRDLLDGLAAVVRGESTVALGTLAGPAARVALALFVGEVLGAAAAWTRAVSAEDLRDHLTALIHAKSLQVELAFHDAGEFHDRLHRARDAGADGPIVLLESLGSILAQLVTLATLAVVVSRFGGLVVMVFVLSVLPAAWLVLSSGLAQHRWRVQATPRLRRATYLDQLLTQPEPAAEIRLYGLGEFLTGRYRKLRGELRAEALGLERRAALTRLLASTSTLGVAGAVLVWVGARALTAGTSLGGVVLLVQAFAQGQRAISALMSNAGTIYRQALLVGGLFDFLELVPLQAVPSTPKRLSPAPARVLRFERVGFAYPGAARRALDGLDLEVPAGSIAAIVGVNGSGKSTLVKLIGRLYDPDEGRVTLDGVDLRELDPVRLRAELAVLVQEQLRFLGTAGENIALGDLGAQADVPRLEAAARAAGADSVLAGLPDGLDTSLGRWLSGVELSVGEWQRLGLARASLRRASVVVLDEPTSAMDSWAESAWLERFRAVTAGRTALIVTHRFTTAMRADVIHVLEAGRVVESGSHTELLALEGRYARSWRAQMAAGDGAVAPDEPPAS